MKTITHETLYFYIGIIMMFSWASVGLSEVSQIYPDKPDYVKPTAEWLDETIRQYGWPEKELKARRPGELLGCSDMAMRLWKRTGKDEYVVIAQAFFEKGMNWALSLKPEAHKKNIFNSDCFLLYPMMVSARQLKEAGKWKAEWDADFAVCAADAMEYAPWLGNSQGNRAIHPMVGAAALARIYANNPKFEPLRQCVDAYWKYQLTIGDLDENSGNYSSIGIYSMIDLAIQLDREKDFLDPRFQNTFTRYRDMLSPAGFIPEWGDDYFNPEGKACWIYIFEYMAQLYKDPVAAGMARKMFARHPQSYPGLVNMKIYPDAVFELPQDSELTYRTNAFEKKTYDKLLLRTSQKPGGAMIMMDLYARGDHCHTDKRASISYYEADHTPLFYNYGRYIQSSANGNQVIFGHLSKGYPHANAWKEGEWRTFSVPTDRMDQVEGDSTGKLREIDSMSFRNDERQNKAVTMTVDNVRLVGPKGIKLIDDFESYDPKSRQNSWWGGKPGDIELVNDCTHGKHALRFKLNDVMGFSSPYTSYACQFNTAEYPELKYDVKYSGAKTPVAQFRVPTLRGGLMAWHYINQPTLMCDVRDVKIEQKGEDVFARVDFVKYGTIDSTLSRSILLTAEGVLLLRDEILPGKEAEGLDGGPLWQLYSLSEQGKNWFTSPGEIPIRKIDSGGYANSGMTVWFAPRPGRETGISVIPNARLGNYYAIQNDQDLRTAYAAEKLVPGKSSVFHTVVVPHKPYVRGADIAGGIRIQGENVTVDLPGKRLILNCNGEAGKWSVSREPLDNRKNFSIIPQRISSKSAKITGNARFIAKVGIIDRWEDAAISLPVEIPEPGSYGITVEQAAVVKEGRSYQVSSGDSSFTAEVRNTGNWDKYESVDAGMLTFKNSGWHDITIKPLPAKEFLMNLKAITVTRKDTKE